MKSTLTLQLKKSVTVTRLTELGSNCPNCVMIQNIEVKDFNLKTDAALLPFAELWMRNFFEGKKISIKTNPRGDVLWMEVEG